jgi:hypothetical protein
MRVSAADIAMRVSAADIAMRVSAADIAGSACTRAAPSFL